MENTASLSQFDNIFGNKQGELIRAGAFIRINMVLVFYLLEEPGSLLG